jgi:SAM-dependent methyltransferase
VVNPAEAYDRYLVPSLFEPWSRELIQRAKVWKGDRVLDVACGTGIVACRIAATGAQVTGLDVTPGMLAQAKVRAGEEGVGVTWVERSAERLPFAAGSFDLVTCQQGVQFVADRAAAVKEMRRVLAPGGRAVIACWTGLEGQPGYAPLHEVARRHFGERGFSAPFSLGGEAVLRGLLAGAGFAPIAIETVTRVCRFPDPEVFVRRTLVAAAGFFPELEALDPELREARITAAAAEATPALADRIEGGQLVMPTQSLLAVGRVRGGS